MTYKKLTKEMSPILRNINIMVDLSPKNYKVFFFKDEIFL